MIGRHNNYYDIIGTMSSTVFASKTFTELCIYRLPQDFQDPFDQSLRLYQFIMLGDVVF